ncbi:PmbA protein [Wolbachia pipientis]|uniref:PmbA protein n=1 Tax=Wolbachia pipientis TaxID=955 RepID=A0A1E7QKH8_WOLPI|nr:TldD/PmbA family protein [Wolbachia pipientis]OEY86846.1 PmbA protein [Wolbachia pipientis]
MDILNIAADITQSIKKRNLYAEVVIHETNKISVSQRLLKIEQVSQSKNCTIGIRAIANKNKSAYVSTNDLTNLDEVINLVIEMAKNAPEDIYIDFATQDLPSVTGLAILDSNIITINDLTKITETAENTALKHDKIINSEGASASYTLTNIALSTATGFIGSFSKSIFTNEVAVIAREKDQMKVGYEYDIGCNFYDLKTPQIIGTEAAQRAAAQLNARTIETSRLPVVLEKRAAKELVKNFASAINSNNVASNSSFLQNSLNASIFSDQITIIDNPMLPKGIASRPFDGEGIVSKKNILVCNGILQNWILDLSSAKRLNLITTGNAIRASNASITPGASNFYIKNGDITFAELIQNITKGIFVTDVFGFGINLINGDYSQGASGFYIENGEITYPVHEITIAGNLKDMLSNITIADDLSFCGQYNSPTIKIAEMTVAGSSKI